MLLIQSVSKFLPKDVIADGLVAAEVMLFRLLSLISLIVFSNVGSGSNFATSILLLIQSGSKLSSKDMISGSRGNNFQIIIFDLINSIFKCWFRFECFCFKYVVNTKRIKIIVKGYSNFSKKELWWNIYWYFIDHFISFWEGQCFWVDINQCFFNLL